MSYSVNDLISSFKDFNEDNVNKKSYHILSHMSEEEGNAKPEYKYLEMNVAPEGDNENNQIFSTNSNMTHRHCNYPKEHNITELIMPHVNTITTGYSNIDEKILEQLTDRIILLCVGHLEGMEDIYLELDRSPYSRYHLLRELVNALVHSSIR